MVTSEIWTRIDRRWGNPLLHWLSGSGPIWSDEFLTVLKVLLADNRALDRQMREAFGDRLPSQAVKSSSHLLGPESESGRPDANDDQVRSEMRAHILGLIPDEVWSEASSGFGDPDLANV